jgi:hypothetical protein
MLGAPSTVRLHSSPLIITGSSVHDTCPFIPSTWSMVAGVLTLL